MLSGSLSFSNFLGSPSINELFGKSLSQLIPQSKDVFYRTATKININWRRLLLRSAKACVCVDDHDPKTADMLDTPCFIIDDTDIPKRGKCMEIIGRVYSHVSHSFAIGYKSLNLAMWTSRGLFHIDFSYHIEMGKDGRQGLSKKDLDKRYAKDRSGHDHIATRVQQASTSKIKAAIKMLRRALKSGIKAPYVLADSWFFCEQLLKAVDSLDIDLVCRLKNNNWLYTYKSKTYTLGKLMRKLGTKQNRTNSRKLKMYYASAEVTYKGQQVVIFMYKNRERGSKWHAILSTDKKLTAIKAYELYANRWSIEVS